MRGGDVSPNQVTAAHVLLPDIKISINGTLGFYPFFNGDYNYRIPISLSQFSTSEGHIVTGCSVRLRPKACPPLAKRWTSAETLAALRARA